MGECIISMKDLFSYLTVFVAFALNALNIGIGSLYGTQSLDIFASTNTELGIKYYNEHRPAPFVFNIIWPIILIWTLSGITYFLVSIFVPVKNSPVKTKPTLAPIPYQACFSFSYAATLAWFFVQDRENHPVALVLLVLAWIFIWSAIGISLHRVHHNTAKLELQNKAMLWLVRMLVHNGLCLLGTWLTIAMALGIGFVIQYEGNFGEQLAITKELVSIEDGSSIILGLLLAALVIWFVLENFILEKYCRYLFTIYPVFIFGFSGIVVNLLSFGAQRNLILASVGLGLAVLAFLARIALSIYRIGCDRSPRDASKLSEDISL